MLWYSVQPKRFVPRSAAPFVNKSVSEETRRAYRRAILNKACAAAGAGDRVGRALTAEEVMSLMAGLDGEKPEYARDLHNTS